MFRDSEVQVFTSARLMDQGNHTIHMYGEGLERNYVLARLCILKGDLESAKNLLQSVLDQKSDHADALKAMEEIRSLGVAAK